MRFLLILHEAHKTSERIGALFGIPCLGGWLHEDTCRVLASAYSKGIEKLSTQLAEVLQSASTEEHEFFNGLRWAVAKLSLVMKEGEHFVMACRCEKKDDGSWMCKALAKGLSTDSVDTHLHDFIVALTATSDAIEEGGARHKSRYSHEELQLQKPDILKPDIFWREREAKVAGRLIIPGEELDGQRRQDLHKLRLRVNGWPLVAADNGPPNQLQGVVNLLQARLADHDRIAEWKTGHPLALPPGVFVGWEGVRKVELISERELCTVHKVHWMPLGEDTQFALKEYRRFSRECFDLEAQIHLRLHHPNVVHCICLLEEHNKCAGLLMELMDGNLREFLEKRHGALSLAEKVGILLDIAKGMEYVHSKGVIHRDLKPENVLVKQSPGGTVIAKVADFNAAKAAKADASSYATLRMGTSVFRAPEVLEDDEEINPKYTQSADVYSFAMVCFHMIAGKQPFNEFPRGSPPWKRIRVDGARPDISQLADGCCPPYLRHCMEAWWDGDPQRRPDFREICRVLRHLYGTLLRCGDPLTELPFMRWDKAAWEAARKEERRQKQDWKAGKGHASQYTRVNEIPYEMYVMRMIVESITSPRSQSSPEIITDVQPPTAASEEQLSRAAEEARLINMPISANSRQDSLRVPSITQSPAEAPTGGLSSFFQALCCSKGVTMSNHEAFHERF